ncbi:DUF4256 domain-containing protein [Phototrophicus methaneseepsis]|uniref:DUF4256 domain-containing protein n=1 Tax=Phototrophicus methaneseepsis TaxID=2710758 RepID=A0A7S8IEV2_9CHLR|nr:DUF4256 domain-containing protein [Phototrophicus methaneseepsis]QPC82213.1 DUF4256 domain-containing protein [Phototrophicus methaneseepsis]
MAKSKSQGKGKGGGTIAKVEINKKPSAKQGEELLDTLKTRFEENMDRHKGLEWEKIQAKLESTPEKLRALYAMESTGGVPDVIDYDKKTDEYIFVDCSKESPEGRRSICYDGQGQAEREKKGVYPAGNATDLAEAMGITLLTEEDYRQLQKLGDFDAKTSSWIATPADIRDLGGAIFADYRFGHVFVYHNTAASFYGARGFRGLLRV